MLTFLLGEAPEEMVVLRIQVVDLGPQQAILGVRSITSLLGLLKMRRGRVVRELLDGKLSKSAVALTGLI